MSSERAAPGELSLMRIVASSFCRSEPRLSRLRNAGDVGGDDPRVLPVPQCLRRHIPINLYCILKTLCRRFRVVRSHRIPGISEASHILREYPRAHMDAGTGLEKPGLADAIPAQRRYPAAVDLHQSDVIAAIRIAVERARVEAGFGFGDCIQQLRIDAVALRGLVPARHCGRCNGENEQGDTISKTSGKPRHDAERLA